MTEKNTLPTILKEQKEAFLKKEIGVKRSMLKEIKKSIRTPQIVVLTGLRRVGKSTLLLQIAKEYLKEDFFFVNFEDERLINFKSEDFSILHEALISIYGEKKNFLIDEIQNVPNWERFVRRMHDNGYKFFITGSNASLLSQELGTRLTGRTTQIELYPFSFKEFLEFKNIKKPNLKNLTTVEKGNLRKLCNDYLNSGGIPDSLKYPKLDIHNSLYNDILYRDISTRYKIKNIKKLKEFSYYIITNYSSLISFNKLKNLLKVGSVTTIVKYMYYLENSWLCFTINKYAYSLKEQEIAPKKVYSIDTGLSKTIGFSFSKNKGKLIENLVFLELKKRYKDIYYYKTKKGREIDFYIPKTNSFLQVTESLSDLKTKEREIRSILEAKEENENFKNWTIITENENEIIKEDGVTIKVIPLYLFLMGK